MKLIVTTNPYVETNMVSERFLLDALRIKFGFYVSRFRCFKLVGAHEKGLIGIGETFRESHIT